MKKILEADPKLAILKKPKVKKVKSKKDAEAVIQLDIMRYLRSKNHLFWRFSPTHYNPATRQYQKHEYIPDGLPDIMVFHPGGHKEYKDPIFMGLEVKSAVGGKKGANQLLIQKCFRLYNCEYFFVKSKQEVIDLGL